MIIYKIIGFFSGFLFSSILDTTLGELNEWAIVGAAVIVATTETINKTIYYLLYRKKNSTLASSVLLDLLKVANFFKIGLIYGLIVDAFKLGS